MNKFIVALIAGAFAAVAGAQTPATTTSKEKAATVGAVTQQAEKQDSGQTDAAQQKANVAKSKQDPKALTTTKEKQATAGAVTTAGSTTTTGATTAAQQKANVEKSKMEPKAVKPKLGSPEAEAAMQKASKP